MTALCPRDGHRLTEAELLTCLTCWAIRPSPLMLDIDPDDVGTFALDLVCNEELLAVNQDSLGKPSMFVFATCGQSATWTAAAPDRRSPSSPTAPSPLGLASSRPGQRRV